MVASIRQASPFIELVTSYIPTVPYLSNVSKRSKVFAAVAMAFATLAIAYNTLNRQSKTLQSKALCIRAASPARQMTIDMSAGEDSLRKEGFGDYQLSGSDRDTKPLARRISSVPAETFSSLVDKSFQVHEGTAKISGKTLITTNLTNSSCLVISVQFEGERVIFLAHVNPQTDDYLPNQLSDSIKEFTQMYGREEITLAYYVGSQYLEITPDLLSNTKKTIETALMRSLGLTVEQCQYCFHGIVEKTNIVGMSASGEMINIEVVGEHLTPMVLTASWLTPRLLIPTVRWPSEKAFELSS